MRTIEQVRKEIEFTKSFIERCSTHGYPTFFEELELLELFEELDSLEVKND